MLRAHSSNGRTTCSHLKCCTVTKQQVQTHRLWADSLEAVCCDVRLVKVDDSHVLRGIGAECADHRKANSYSGCFCRTGKDIDSFQKSPAHSAFLLTLAANVMLKWPILKFRKQAAQPQQ